MRFPGTRRARLIILLAFTAVMGGLWLAGREWVLRLQQSIVPTLLAQAEQALGRDIEVGTLDYSVPGLIVAKDLRVSQVPDFKAGTYLSASRVEVHYAPELYAWNTLLTRGKGADARAWLRVQNLRIWDPNSRSPGEALTVERVETALDLGPALDGGDVVGTIRQVRVTRPTLRLTRSRSGDWNVQSLLPKPKHQRPLAFRGEVIGTDARFEVTDYLPGALPAPARNEGRGDFTLSLTEPTQPRFSVSATVAGPRGGTVALEGHQSSKRAFFLTLAARSSDLAYWTHYFAQPTPQFQVVAASGSIQGAVWHEENAPLAAYSLAMDLERGAIRMKGWREPIQDFRGRLDLLPYHLSLQGAATLGGARWTAEGDLDFGAKPRYRFRVSTPAVNVALAKRMMPTLALPPELRVPRPLRVLGDIGGDDQGWSARGRASIPSLRYGNGTAQEVVAGFAARGTTTALVAASAEITSRQVRYEGWNGTNARMEVRLADQRLDIQGDLLTAGGATRAHGWMDLSQPRHPLYVVGRAQHVALERLPLSGTLAKYRLAGIADAQLVVSGDEKAPILSAYLRVPTLRIGERVVREVAGRVRYSEQGVRVEYASINDPRLRAALTGTVTTEGELALRVTARGLDLTQLLEGELKEPVRGDAWVMASVTGTTEAPKLEGALQVYQPGFRQWDADYLSAGFELSDLQHARLRDVTLLRAPDRLTATEIALNRPEGEPGATTEWQVEGTVMAEGLSVNRLLRLAGAEQAQLERAPLGGELEPVKLEVLGPVTQLAVSFEAASPRLAFNGFNLGRVETAGRLDLAQKTVELSTLTAASPTLRLSASGSLRWEQATAEAFAQNTQIDLKVEGGGLRLRPLLQRYAPQVLEYADTRGTLDLQNAEIHGTLAAPEGTATLAISDLVVNDRALRLTPFHLAWNPEAAVLTGLRARPGSGRLEAPYLVMGLGDRWHAEDPLRSLAGELHLRETPVPVLRQLLDDSPYYATEAARGLVGVLRRWREPIAGAMNVEASLPLTAGDAEDEISAETPLTPATAARLLEARAEVPTARATLRVTGLESPPGREQPATEILGEVNYRAGRVEIARLNLRSGGTAELSLSGTIEELGKEGERWDLRAGGRGLNLATLARLPISGLSDQLSPLQPLDGTLRMEASVVGNIARPEAHFTVSVERPMVAGIPFDTLEVLGGGYDAARGLLLMESAHLTKHLPPGEGDASVTATGSLPITWPELSIPRDQPRHLGIELPSQSLRVFSQLADDAEAEATARPNTKSPPRELIQLFREIAATQGRMEGRALLGGTADNPKNEGFFAVSDATVRYDGMETAVRNFQARVELDQNLIRVTRFEGESSRGGTLRGGGVVTLGGSDDGSTARLDLTVALDRFRFEERKVGAMAAAFAGTRASGVLRTVDPTTRNPDAPIRIVGDWPSPVIQGAVELDNASLFLAFQQLPGGEAVTLPGKVGLDLRLLTGNNVLMRNPQARLNLNGELRATNTLQAPAILGTLRVSRGSITLPTLRLRNVEGDIRVAYDRRGEEIGLPGPAPVTVDLVGYTSVRMQRPGTLESEDYDVTVQVRGDPSAGGAADLRSIGSVSGLQLGTRSGLTVTVHTDPPLPGGQIEALIRQQLGTEGFNNSGSNVVEALGGQLEQVFALGVSTALTGRIEDTLQSKLGLDIFAIDVGIAQPLRVRIGKRLFGNFYGTVVQELAGVQGPQQRFEAYYRLTPSFRVGYRREEPIRRDIFFFQGTHAF